MDTKPEIIYEYPEPPLDSFNPIIKSRKTQQLTATSDCWQNVHIPECYTLKNLDHLRVKSKGSTYPVGELPTNRSSSISFQLCSNWLIFAYHSELWLGRKQFSIMALCGVYCCELVVSPISITTTITTITIITTITTITTLVFFSLHLIILDLFCIPCNSSKNNCLL